MAEIYTCETSGREMLRHPSPRGMVHLDPTKIFFRAADGLARIDRGGYLGGLGEEEVKMTQLWISKRYQPKPVVRIGDE